MADDHGMDGGSSKEEAGKAAIIIEVKGIGKARVNLEWPEIPAGDTQTSEEAEITATTYYDHSGAIMHREVTTYA